MRKEFILGKAILKTKVSHPGWLFSWCYYNHPVMTSLMQKKQPFFFFSFSFFREKKQCSKHIFGQRLSFYFFFGTLFTFPCHLNLFIKHQTLDLGTLCPFWCRSPCWQLCLALHTWEDFLSLTQQALFWLARALLNSPAFTQLWLRVGNHGWWELNICTVQVSSF